jgi:uncharacterized protein YoxC
MIVPAQILLVIVISVLTLLLTVIGVQVFFIFKELRHSVEKMNKILDDAGKISESVAKPFSAISGSLSSFSSLAGALGWLVNRAKKKENKEQENE